MSTEVRFRGGTSAQHASFTGAQKEVTVDTTLKTLRVHDGVTPGGSPLATKADISDQSTALNAKLNVSAVDTDSALAANKDDLVPSQKAVRSALALKLNVSDKGIVAGLRNKIINGDFDVWQRGTSFTASGPQYTADRWWRSFAGSTLASTLSKQSFANGQTAVPGNPKSFLRYATTAAALTEHSISQPIEGVQTLAGKKATLTIYAQGGFTMPSIELVQKFGTGGSPSPNVVTQLASAVPIASGWAKYQYVVDLPSISGKTLGSNSDDALSLVFKLPLSGAFTFDLAHCSLVEGDASSEADSFSPRHPQQEIDLCQRYLEDVAFYWIGDGLNGLAYGTSTGFKVEKRGIPTGWSIAASGVANGGMGARTLGIASTRGAAVVAIMSAASGPARGFYDIWRFDAEVTA